MGMIILTALILTELAFMIWNIAEGDLHRKEKAVSAIAIFLIFVTLCLTGVIEWGFRYYILGFALALQSIIAVIRLIKQDKTEAFGRVIGKSVGKFVGKTILYTTVLMLAIICPQFTEPEPTGQYNVLEAKYTWTDENRTETFTDTGIKRKITVCVWYPENCSEKTPLIIFSHGAFGFSGSNYSTCTELASRGYTVAGIDHTYHSLFTADTEGNVTIADMNFINTVMEHNATDNPEKEYTDNREWLDLRVKDIDFALNTIIGLSQSGDPIFGNTDTTKIGLFGHSLGGAAAAQTARNRSDISAVINLDGTLLGDEIAFENGGTVYTDEPFPVPMLDIYSQYLYDLVNEYKSENKLKEYVNFHTAQISENVVSTYFKDSGHLNFTDLPLFSPMLGKALGNMGTGDIDSLYCINTMNKLTGDFFDYALKGKEKPEIEKEY